MPGSYSILTCDLFLHKNLLILEAFPVPANRTLRCPSTTVSSLRSFLLILSVTLA